MVYRDHDGNRTDNRNSGRHSRRDRISRRSRSAALLIILIVAAVIIAGCTSARNTIPSSDTPEEEGPPAGPTTAAPQVPDTLPSTQPTVQPAAQKTTASVTTVIPVTATTARPTTTKTATTVTTPATAYTRPASGTVIAGKRILGGDGRLRIDNVNGSSDVVAILTRWHGKTPLFAVYVRRGDIHTNDYIPEGMYDLFVLAGENWDPQKNTFADNVAYLKFEDALRYTSYSKWTVSLYPVEDGNADIETVPKGDFPNL